MRQNTANSQARRPQRVEAEGERSRGLVCGHGLGYDLQTPAKSIPGPPRAATE